MAERLGPKARYCSPGRPLRPVHLRSTRYPKHPGDLANPVKEGLALLKAGQYIALKTPT